MSDVLVWYVLGEDIAAIARDGRLAASLSADEVERTGRFRSEADRDRYVVGRVLARSLLSRLEGGPPDSWRIEPDASGCPRVVGPGAAAAPTFSITHTDGLVACAAGRSMELGLDAEAAREASDLLRIARRFFSPAEVAFVEGHPDDRRAFHTCWTLKEAWVKARGIGITLPLDSFTFDLSSSPPAFSCDPNTEGDPDSWRFRSWWPTDRHAMAVAARTRPPGDIDLRAIRVMREVLSTSA